MEVEDRLSRYISDMGGKKCGKDIGLSQLILKVCQPSSPSFFCVVSLYLTQLCCGCSFVMSYLYFCTVLEYGNR